METTEKMVEIARFTNPDEAQLLVALLKSEGIDCYVRNEISNRIVAGYLDIGGSRVELLEGSVQRALEIMQENGYEIPDENEQSPGLKTVSGLASHIPFLKNFPLEKQIFYFLIFIALFLVVLFYASQLLLPNQMN